MILPQDDLDELVSIIRDAESGLVEEMRKGRVSEEVKLTERLVGRLGALIEKSKLRRRFEVRMIAVHSVTVEKKLGADLCIVLKLQSRNFELTKGVLLQAKREDSWLTIKGPRNVDESLDQRGAVSVDATFTQDFANLATQARNMLKHSPASFGIVYGDQGFVTVPASSIVGVIGSEQLRGKTLSRFFRDFFVCFIGDAELKANDEDDLKALVEKTESKSAILLKVQEKGEDRHGGPPLQPPPDALIRAVIQGMKPHTDTVEEEPVKVLAET